VLVFREGAGCMDDLVNKVEASQTVCKESMARGGRVGVGGSVKV